MRDTFDGIRDEMDLIGGCDKLDDEFAPIG